MVRRRVALPFKLHFAGKTFRQVIGTAMGTSCAPTYANIFLASYEAPALEEFKLRLLFYKRFIDDTFAIIKGTREDVTHFQERFGSLPPNMRMQWSVSQRRQPFLDIEVSLGPDPKIALAIALGGNWSSGNFIECDSLNSRSDTPAMAVRFNLKWNCSRVENWA